MSEKENKNLFYNEREYIEIDTSFGTKRVNAFMIKTLLEQLEYQNNLIEKLELKLNTNIKNIITDSYLNKYSKNDLIKKILNEIDQEQNIELKIEFLISGEAILNVPINEVDLFTATRFDIEVDIHHHDYTGFFDIKSVETKIINE